MASRGNGLATLNGGTDLSRHGATAEQRVLTLVGNVVDMLELEDFRRGLLSALHETIPSNHVSFNEVSPDPEQTFALSDPAVAPPDLYELFARYAHENPIVAYYQRTGSGTATRFSDLCSTAELHATNLYQQVYRPLNVEYQIAFTLPSTTHLLGIALSRGAGDFSDLERDILNLARPFLVQAYRNALAHSRLLEAERARPPATPRLPLRTLMQLGCSEREAEVLRLVAMGRSDRAAAEELSISPRTVQKHLERCYATLGVHSRSAAAQIVWRTLEPSEPSAQPTGDRPPLDGPLSRGRTARPTAG